MLKRYEKLQHKNLHQFMINLKRHFEYVQKIVHDATVTVQSKHKPRSLIKEREEGDKQYMYDTLLDVHSTLHKSDVLDNAVQRNAYNKNIVKIVNKTRDETEMQLVAATRQTLGVVQHSLESLFSRIHDLVMYDDDITHLHEHEAELQYNHDRKKHKKELQSTIKQLVQPMQPMPMQPMPMQPLQPMPMQMQPMPMPMPLQPMPPMPMQPMPMQPMPMQPMQMQPMQMQPMQMQAMQPMQPMQMPMQALQQMQPVTSFYIANVTPKI